MLFWGEFDSSFTFFCMQLSIMMFWIEFDLIFAFFYMLVFWIKGRPIQIHAEGNWVI